MVHNRHDSVFTIHNKARIDPYPNGPSSRVYLSGLLRIAIVGNPERENAPPTQGNWDIVSITCSFLPLISPFSLSLSRSLSLLPFFFLLLSILYCSLLFLSLNLNSYVREIEERRCWLSLSSCSFSQSSYRHRHPPKFNILSVSDI